MKSTTQSLALFTMALLGLTAAAFAGTIVGHVTYSGNAPQPTALKIDADQFCISNGQGHLSSDLIVSKAGGVQNVVISLLKVPGNFEPPEQGPVIDQVNCAYTPHVLAVMTGTTVNVRTSDSTLHNVHAHAKKNTEINWAMPIKNMALPYQTTSAEAVKLTCDVHSWMSGYIVVLDNPFFAVAGINAADGRVISAADFRASGAKGGYRIANIPAGTYRVQAWHETLGVVRTKVEVPAIGETELNFTSNEFTKKGRRK